MDRLVVDIAILVLAGFVGYAVISKVPNTLHTPLMSGTNAIHGIVVLGGLLLMAESSGVLEKILLVIAVAFGTINADRRLPRHRSDARHVQGKGSAQARRDRRGG
jgi:NAD(P) transhydrogenase subunit alpha